MTIDVYRDLEPGVANLGWQRAPAPERTAPEATSSAEALRTAIKSVFPLWTVTGRRPAKPVQVWAWKGHDLFFAENPNLHIFATGETLAEAVQEFREQFAQQCEHYRQVPWEQVTGEAARLKQLFLDLF